MSWLALAAILAAFVVTSIAGLSLIKLAGSTFTPSGILGFALYVCGFLLWIFIILKSMPLSTAFPVAAGALILGSQVSGWLWLKESISPLHIVSVALIVAGIVMLGILNRPPG
jgi:quaternary ammonium compound-resistance protein SugE